jgi:hypothetical protein
VAGSNQGFSLWPGQIVAGSSSAAGSDSSCVHVFPGQRGVESSVAGSENWYPKPMLVSWVQKINSLVSREHIFLKGIGKTTTEIYKKIRLRRASDISMMVFEW